MKINTILFLFTVLICMSCSESEELINDASKKENEHTLTPAEASSNVLEFITKMNTSSRSTTPATIADVQPFILPSDIASRASVQCPDTLFYVVNFANDKGFAIAGADDRDPKIYAIVEDGTFSYNDSTAVGFNMFLSNLINMKLFNTMSENPDDTDDHPGENPDDPDGGGGGGTGNGNGGNQDYFEYMYPSLVTRWNQEGLYSMYCPSDCLAGCAPVAISQICSFLEYPTNINYTPAGATGYTYLNWNAIKQESILNGGHQTSEGYMPQVALLIRYWGYKLDVDYEENEPAGVGPEHTIDIMQQMMPSQVSDLNDYNVDNVINDLNDGNKIIFMCGYARYYHIWLVIPKYVDGHAWVVDGYIRQRQNGEVTKYIHCNWGWGGLRNGYFLSDVLNADESPVYDDFITSRSQNYRYKLKTSTFTK